MDIKRLLSAKGIHFLITRFGPRKLRSLAFDAKYKSGDWCFQHEGTSALGNIVRRYLKNGDLLVMGCGGASILENLEADGLTSALGIDISDEALQLAGRFASDKVSFLKSDMLTFECPHPFDVILFSESLNYVPANKQVPLLAKLAGHLKPGGVFIVTFAQARRYRKILAKIRKNFKIIEDSEFSGTSRHLIIFQ